jgi:hypothetical protein
MVGVGNNAPAFALTVIGLPDALSTSITRNNVNTNTECALSLDSNPGSYTNYAGLQFSTAEQSAVE